MNDGKILIKGKKYNVKLIALCVFAVFFIIAAILFVAGLSTFGNLITEFENHVHRESCYKHMGYTGLPIPYCRFSYFSTGEAYASQMFLETTVVNVLIILGIGAAASIVVFLILKNIDKIQSLLKVKQKSKRSTSSVADEKRTNTPDDLVKLKELLDKGIITQEDFDAKKKQILGL